MRLRHLGILIALALLATVIVAAAAAAGEPSLKQLKTGLRAAEQHRQLARERARVATADLAGARALTAATVAVPTGMSAALAAGLLADGVVTADEVAALQARADKRQQLARRWSLKVGQLQRRIRELAQIALWDRRGDWRPLIAIAGREYGVSAAGLYRMMMLESGGQRTADSGPYHGLFQFMDREWAASWNRWRGESIYDGWAQIRLTALAISRGMGPSIWPLTYRMSF